MLEYIREASLAEVHLVPYFQDMLYEALDMSNSMEGPSPVRYVSMCAGRTLEQRPY